MAIGWSWRILEVSFVPPAGAVMLTIVVLLGNVIWEIYWVTAVLFQQPLFDKRTVGFRNLFVSFRKTC